MKLVLPLCILILLVSCKESKKTEEDLTQMEQVMTIHDEVMPKMRKLARLVAEIKPKVDSTAAGKDYKVAMTDLQEANKSMMNWMMVFGERFNSDEILEGKELSPQKQKWLDEEEIKVIALKKQINSSIEKAEVLLDLSLIHI